MAEENSGLLEAARPLVRVNGKDNAALSEGLLHLAITENTNGLYRCEATFGNWGPTNNRIDFLYFDRASLDFGKPFQVIRADKPLFDGRIMALEGKFGGQGDSPSITVLAEDRFQDLRMTRRTRTFNDSSDADIARRIASDHGLSADVALDGPTHRVIAQVNLSDLAFLRERARSLGAELWIDGSSLKAKTRQNRRGAELQLKYGRQVREVSVLADLAGQRTSVSVAGWDTSSKETVKHEATDSVLGSELNGDLSGPRILSSTLGTRKEAIVHNVPFHMQEAQSIAEAYFKMSCRRFVTARGVAEVDNRMRVGNIVDLQGLGPLFSGKYYLAEVRHLFDGKNGFRTEFVGERPGLGQAH
jgi:uncharacterized protein